VCPDLALRPSQILYEEDLDRKTEMQGLNLVHFHFLPHLNSEYFLKLRKENIESAIVGMKNKIYAADDESAIKVVDGKVEIVGEGEVVEFN
jgi:dipeptidase E